MRCVFGERDQMLTEAHKRISKHPDKYVDHVYGEKEAGGTSVLYLSSVPFGKLGFPDVDDKPYPAVSKFALHAVPPAVLAVGAMLGGIFHLLKRKGRNGRGRRMRTADAIAHHPTFAPLQEKLWTPFNQLLAVLMGFGLLSLIARFVLGLGGSTHLSDTYAWGLWIVFDLVWIAIAAGAFATAGIIYVFQRKDLYAMGRAAVLMGFLSYSFVTVTLIADLGLPLHFYQIGLQAPEHSAMFEVSWCIGLYVTVLLLEFLPVPLQYHGFQKAVDVWRRWSGAYVAFALTLFVYLLSRNLVYAAAAAILFGLLAYAFRAYGRKGEPIMLAIAAVTLSTMHQSSLGSLFLLMPDKLAPQWWSPVMPVSFLLSAIAAGTAVVMLVEMWIAKAWSRRLSRQRDDFDGQNHFLGASGLPRVSVGRPRDSAAARRRVLRKNGRALCGRAHPWRLSAAGSAGPLVPTLSARRAVRRSASLRVGRRVQSHQCRSLGHGPERDRCRRMLRHPIGRPLLNGAFRSGSSPQRYSCSGSACGCSRCCPTKTPAGRRRVTLDLWVAEHPYLEPMARLDAEVDREIDGMRLGTA